VIIYNFFGNQNDYSESILINDTMINYIPNIKIDISDYNKKAIDVLTGIILKNI